MALVKLKFRNHSFEVNCEDPERVYLLAENVNEMIESLGSSKNVADTKIAYLSAIYMADKVLNLQTQLDELAEKTEKSSADSSNILIETFNYVAEYVESLAEKVKSS